MAIRQTHGSVAIRQTYGSVAIRDKLMGQWHSGNKTNSWVCGTVAIRQTHGSVAQLQ